MRFIYNGQDLRDDARTLQACNIGDNCTMHCLITAQTRAAPSHDSVAEEDEDSFMGAMMYPLFTVVILIVWYFRFTYRLVLVRPPVKSEEQLLSRELVS